MRIFENDYFYVEEDQKSIIDKNEIIRFKIVSKVDPCISIVEIPNEVKLSYILERKFDFSEVKSGDYVIITRKSKDGTPKKPFMVMYQGSCKDKIFYADYEDDLSNIEKITKVNIGKETLEELWLC